jgi:hypothetical protein
MFYIAWFLLVLAPLAPTAGQTSLLFKVGLASFFWLFGGFGPALALMSLPWIMAVRAYRRQQWSGPIYFAAAGAFGTFIIGCAAASLSPKPLFVEDQTFFEGVLIAAERQGICLLLAGIIFGFAYWLLSERKILAARQLQGDK